MSSLPLLTLLVTLPILGAVMLLLIDAEDRRSARVIGTAFSGLTLLVAIAVLLRYDIGAAGMQLVERADWIPRFGISYYLGVDGLSLPLVLLTAVLGFLAMIGSFTTTRSRERFYVMMLLILEGALLGVFLALDVVMFYLFWEAVLIPMYFLIGIWGGARRRYAANKFFIYTFAGSIFMLLGLLVFYFSGDHASFDLVSLAERDLAGNVALLVFGLTAIGFAVKIPTVPFHTWLPDAHVEAPTAVSVLLAGVLLKMGAYGFMRVSAPLLPNSFDAYAPILYWVAVISIVYGALLAFAQTDLKRLVAYSSISHMGFVLAGIVARTEASLTGAAVLMVAHGLITGFLFFLVGMVYERTHTRDMAQLGGLATTAPGVGWLLVFAALASLGLPGLVGFIGESLIIIGVYKSLGWLVVGVVAGVFLNAVYLLTMVKRTVFGRSPENHSAFPDLTVPEVIVATTLVILIVLFGVAPGAFTAITRPYFLEWL